MNTYYSRPLASVMVKSHSKVIVLEGARAVGKTSMVQEELKDQGYHYYTLAENDNYKRALEDVDAWIASLKRPAIIDEAQRIPDLPLAVKEVVDRLNLDTPYFILTGSATINRGGLDGQDPLTRRARRFSLHPLTQAEVRRRQGCLVDDLFDAAVDESYVGESLSRSEILAMMRIGGFPGYVTSSKIMSEDERSMLIRGDIEQVLGDTLLPGERIDRAIAQRILDKLLIGPGDTLNVSSMANACEINAATVNRYMSIFLRRFLIHTLPNLAAPPRKQSFTRGKVHPIDTSFSIDALSRAGEDIDSDATAYGKVFESFVVNQIVPSISWSKDQFDSFYWRDAKNKPKEVDLVLLRHGELVGVEVKSANSLKDQDFAGLRALGAADSRFRRGFVIYAGQEVRKFGENLWGIPLSSLWDSALFARESSEVIKGSLPPAPSSGAIVRLQQVGEAGAPVDAALFLSYCRDDDEHLGGRIVQYAKDLVEEYNFQYGSTIALFVDGETLNWESAWPEELARRGNAVNLVVPALTPRYLVNDTCRREFLDFHVRLERMPYSTMMPLLWQNIGHEEGARSADPLVDMIATYEQLDISDLQYAERSERAYRESLVEASRMIRRSVERGAVRVPGASAAQECEVRADYGDETDARHMIPHLEDRSERIRELMSLLGRDLATMRGAFERHPMPIERTADHVSLWADEIAKESEESVKSADVVLVELKSSLEGYYALMSRCLLMISERFPDLDGTVSFDGLKNAIVNLSTSVAVTDEMKGVESTIRNLAALAPVLQPSMTTMGNVVKLLSTTAHMSKNLLGEIEALEEERRGGAESSEGRESDDDLAL